VDTQLIKIAVFWNISLYSLDSRAVYIMSSDSRRPKYWYCHTVM